MFHIHIHILLTLCDEAIHHNCDGDFYPSLFVLQYIIHKCVTMSFEARLELYSHGPLTGDR